MTAEALEDPRRSGDSHILRYRPDLDGLRAIAVLAVTLFHFRPSLLPSGYLGVDIFFVLSGYLITAISVRQLLDGNFTIAEFYRRRIRRIAPALLLVLFVTTGLSMALLLPVDLVGYGYSLLSTLIFASNFYFWRDTDYFSREAGEKPLLHTWSLAIEEQFYLFFPLLLAFLFRLLPRASKWIIAILSLGSLLLYFATEKFGAVIPAFYLLPTRAWELGAGVSLAMFQPRVPAKSFHHLLSVAGIGALVAALVLSSDALPLGFSELLAVGGAVILIWTGDSDGGYAAVNALLRKDAPAAIGKISYSMYLWHWPIIVFARYYLVRELSLPEILVAGIGLLGISALSWRFVEQPFRSRAVSVSTVAIASAAGALILAGIGALLISLHGLPARMSPQAARVNGYVNTVARCSLSDYVLFGASRACKLNLPSNNPADAKVVLAGNSFALMYGPLFREALVSSNLPGILVPSVGCFPTTEINIDTGCENIANSNIAAIIALKKARVVVIAFDWAFEKPLVDELGRPVTIDMDGRVIAAVDRTIARIEASGKQVVLIGPLARPGWDVASDTSRAIAFHRTLSSPTSVSLFDFQRQYGAVLRHYAQRPDLVFVRPDAVQCPHDSCRYFDDSGMPLFTDITHIARPALPIFRDVIVSGLDEGLKRSSLATVGAVAVVNSGARTAH